VRDAADPAYLLDRQAGRESGDGTVAWTSISVLLLCSLRRISSIAMILVRHGHAESKARWNREESQRPLSARGEMQARALVLTLAGDDLSELWSSPTTRCRQTLAPLAADRGLVVHDHPLLAKDAQATRLLPWVLAHAGEPWAICTHGEVFEALFRVGREAGLVTARPMLTEKGSAWRVIGRQDGSTEMEYVPPGLLS